MRASHTGFILSTKRKRNVSHTQTKQTHARTHKHEHIFSFKSMVLKNQKQKFQTISRARKITKRILSNFDSVFSLNHH